MGHTLVYDLETKKTFDEVGGQKNHHLLGISLAGVYNYTDDTYYAFKEQQLDQFKVLLQDCDLLIGFNSKYFDNPVLQPYMPDLDLSSIPHIDMLEVVTKELGHRVKLDNIAQTTLAEGKSGSGLDAIRYFRLGQWDELEKYCIDDVRVTKDVYEYGKTHGYVWFIESGTPTRIPIDWGQAPYVDEILHQAHTEHKQVDIEYIQVIGTGSQSVTERVTTTLDIKNMSDGKITAFSTFHQKQSVFDRAKVFTATLSSAPAAHQQSLI